MKNSADSDQMASSVASCSGSMWFSKVVISDSAGQKIFSLKPVVRIQNIIWKI